MRLSGNTVLITGGATGIGLAVARALVREGNEVIICGRRRDRLQAAKAQVPGLRTRVCDVSNAASRRALVKWVTSSFGTLNVLVNNAGVQHVVDFREGPRDLDDADEEVATNLRAPIHLTALLVPHLLKQKESAIVNISSGLAYAPLAMIPVYCATKAALHSLSLSLRHQLKDTPIKVFEIAPPRVDTDLGWSRHAKGARPSTGIGTETVAAAVLKALENDDYEVAVGAAENLRAGRDRLFEQMNR
ncbi:MAG: SDR family NAD(P)-dependent oxidoreductase [Gemmatimonadales bacterium]|nr:SDR family NAD(P)-dependent oxidoreductase [Gemmatimonadales bacterium]